MNIDNNKQALKITLIYLVIGSLWILLSDKTVALHVKDPFFAFEVNVAKGWFYVIATSALLFSLVHTSIKKLTNHASQLQQLNQEISREILEKEHLCGQLRNHMFLVEKANEAMLFLDKEGNITQANEAAERIYGYSKKELMTLNISALMKESTKHILDVSQDEDKKWVVFESVHYKKDGSAFDVEVSALTSYIGDQTLHFGILRDISGRKKAETEMQFLSYHDPLTGLYNRRFYEDELGRLNIESKLPLTLILADINGLKMTNDVFGHLAGDDLIKRVADILSKGARNSDIIARVGGDEFVILMPNTDSAESEEVIHRITESINKEHDSTIILSASLGWSTRYTTDEKMDVVFKRAEDQMYLRKLSESLKMKYSTIDIIMKTLSQNSSWEERHAQRVSELSASLANALQLSEDQVNTLRLAGLMHDIGKIAISEDTLSNPGRLDEQEWMEVKRHPEIGYNILSSVNRFTHLAPIVRSHHERWDGTGYPEGLKGEEIPLTSRVIAISDAYEAMTSDRSYRCALTRQEALAELQRNAGTQFDPALVAIFILSVIPQMT